jgi:hypothetical protein
MWLRRARARGIGAVLALVLLGIPLGACSKASRSPARVPPAPATPKQRLDPSAPPVVYIGGLLTDVAADRIEVQEPSGRVVAIQRLSQGATVFFRVAGSAWARLPTSAPVPTGQPTCVETLMDGSNLLALRVFLGADCGPS